MRYLLDIVIIGLVFVYGIKPKMNNLSLKGQILLFLFSGYLIGVYVVTLMPFRPINHLLSTGFSFSVYTEAFGDVINSRGPALREVVLNVIMFIPFGLLYPLLKQEIRSVDISFFKMVSYSMAFSLLIEFLQMFSSSRSSDVTDLITNTIGGAVGYLLYKLIVRPTLRFILGENEI